MKENLKILIADDSELMRVMMRGFFSKYLVGAVVYQSTNLEDTYAALKEEDIDLLVLDINMPDGDSSPQIVVEIKKEYPDLKIVMFSGNDKVILEPSYLEAGALGFIQKDEHIKSYTQELLNQIF
jgi:DNA-binding NarL/FixJ family response regulator